MPTTVERKASVCQVHPFYRLTSKARPDFLLGRGGPGLDRIYISVPFPPSPPSRHPS